MKYSSPDKNWNQPPNSVENYNIKRDLYQYLSGTNQLKVRFSKKLMEFDLSNEFLKNAKKCLVKISSQKFSSERSLLFYSILNFIITDCCSRSITRILFSSFQRIGILLSNYYFSPFLTNINPKTNQVQTITVMVQKKLACQSVALLCARPGQIIHSDKVGCVFPMVIWSEFRMGQDRDD